MKKILLVLCSVGLLAFGACSAEARSVECADGRTVVLSPFNQMDPCNEGVIEKAEVPDGVLLVYGAPPVSEKGKDSAIKNAVARVNYMQKMAGFAGVDFAPPAYAAVAEVYDEAGFGEPIFYSTHHASYVKFPDAPYEPAVAVRSTALLAPMVVIASHHVDVIRKGYCLPVVHPFVPNALRLANAENCEVE